MIGTTIYIRTIKDNQLDQILQIADKYNFKTGPQVFDHILEQYFKQQEMIERMERKLKEVEDNYKSTVNNLTLDLSFFIKTISEKKTKIAEVEELDSILTEKTAHLIKALKF